LRVKNIELRYGDPSSNFTGIAMAIRFAQTGMPLFAARESQKFKSRKI